MKKITILTCILCMALSLQSQENIRTFKHLKKGNAVEVSISEIDSITFSKFSVPNSPTGVLINGVLWATCNVNTPGTFATLPSEAGMFYQWNRKVGWSSTDPMVNSEGGTTWDSSLPEGDTWEKSKDPCPSGWRVPSFEEQQSLLNSGSFWGELNGVSGRFFFACTQRVFFPAAGCRYFSDGMLYSVGGNGYFWSGTPNGSGDAYGLDFGSGNAVTGSYGRGVGFSVRCVSE
jgi:uncharacterized protein (TIGR02145 family)